MVCTSGCLTAQSRTCCWQKLKRSSRTLRASPHTSFVSVGWEDDVNAVSSDKSRQPSDPLKLHHLHVTGLASRLHPISVCEGCSCVDQQTLRTWKREIRSRLAQRARGRTASSSSFSMPRSSRHCVHLYVACADRWWRATAGRFQRSEIGFSWKREWGKREVELPLRARHYKRRLHLEYTQINTLRCVRVSDFWYYRAYTLAKST